MIRYETADGIALITLCAPERRNAFRLEDADAFAEALLGLGGDTSIRGVVLAAEGGVFCAGADRSFLQSVRQSPDGAAQRRFYRIFTALMDVPIPVVCAIEGPAIGAGLNLALACDAVIAGPGATFQSRFLELGLHPGGAHCHLLIERVGSAVASQMVLFGRILGIQDALSAGLVLSIVNPGEARESAVALLESTRSVARNVVVATKSTMRKSAEMDFSTALELERVTQLTLLQIS